MVGRAWLVICVLWASWWLYIGSTANGPGGRLSSEGASEVALLAAGPWLIGLALKRAGRFVLRGE